LVSPNTHQAYRTDLADFLLFCDQRHIDALTASRVDVAGYLQHLQRLGRSPATLARRLVTLRGFYDLAMTEYGVPASPVARIRMRRPRSQSRLPSLTAAELAAFLATADAAGKRTAALAWLLATTGLRISEACNTRIEDLSEVNAHERWLDVTCKGNLRRSVPLHDDAWRRLQPLMTQTRGCLFVTRTGARLDRRAASRALGRVAAQAGITMSFSPHVLRHTFVTLARANGCHLEDVQDAAGHADPATTRGYDRTVLAHERHPAHRILQALCPTPPADTASAEVIA
jgi:site-specific recombinase XerD